MAESPPNFFSLDALAKGFCKIEKHCLCVAEIRLHPDDVSDFLGAMAVDPAMVVPRDEEKPIGQIWQTGIWRDAAIPRTRLKLISDLGGYGDAPKRDLPIEVWV